MQDIYSTTVSIECLNPLPQQQNIKIFQRKKGNKIITRWETKHLHEVQCICRPDPSAPLICPAQHRNSNSKQQTFPICLGHAYAVLSTEDCDRWLFWGPKLLCVVKGVGSSVHLVVIWITSTSTSTLDLYYSLLGCKFRPIREKRSVMNDIFGFYSLFHYSIMIWDILYPSTKD